MAFRAPVTASDPAKWPDRLNLGYGWDRGDGYLNVDLHAFHEPDLVADVTDLHMLPSGRYQHILAQDLLEHLPRTATAAALAEWNRLLAPGGFLTLRVPSLLDLVELFQRNENLVPARQELMIQCLFGTQAYTGDFHQTTFTRPLLEDQLRGEGFEPRCVEVAHEWLLDIDAEKVGDSDYAERWAPHADLAGPDGRHGVPPRRLRQGPRPRARSARRASLPPAADLRIDGLSRRARSAPDLRRGRPVRRVGAGLRATGARGRGYAVARCLRPAS